MDLTFVETTGSQLILAAFKTRICHLIDVNFQSDKMYTSAEDEVERHNCIGVAVRVRISMRETN